MHPKTTALLTAFATTLACLTTPRAATAGDQRRASSSHKEFSFDGKLYPASFRGLKLYMNDLAHDDPRLHAKLRPQFRKLRAQNIVGWTMFGTLLPAGLILTSYGAVSTSGDDGTPSLNTGVLIASGALMIAGAAGLFVRPRGQRILDFINLHNSFDPDAPLRLAIAPSWSLHGAGATVRLRF